MAVVGAVAVGSAGLLLACAEVEPSTRGETPVPVAAYIAVVNEHLPPLPPPAGDDEPPPEPPVVFIAAIGDSSLSLADQVAVIDSVAETHDVRFVDTPGAAIDGDLPDAPARDGGVLIGLGVMRAEAPHTVRVEIYRDADDVTGRLVTVDVDEGDDDVGTVWFVAEAEDVEPEVLVGVG